MISINTHSVSQQLHPSLNAANQASLCAINSTCLFVGANTERKAFWMYAGLFEARPVPLRISRSSKSMRFDRLSEDCVKRSPDLHCLLPNHKHQPFDQTALKVSENGGTCDRHDCFAWSDARGQVNINCANLIGRGLTIRLLDAMLTVAI